MERIPISAVWFDEDTLVLEGPGLKIRADLKKVSKRLLLANEVERAVYQFSASGHRLLWPSLDLSVSVHELIRKFGTPELIDQVFKKKDNKPGRLF